MDKIVISPVEIADTMIVTEQSARPEPKLVPVVPWWAKISLVGHSIAGVELSSVATRQPNSIAAVVYLEAAYPYAFEKANGPTMKQFLALQGPQPPTPAESDFRSLTALQKWDAEVYGFQLPVSEFQQTWDSAPDGRVEKPRDFPGSEIFMTIMNGTTKYTRIPVPALLSLRRIVGLPRFGPWVTGTRVDVRNLKVRFRSSQISFARHFTRQLRPFHRPKCPSEKHQPWPNWRCANSDLSAESNYSLR